MPVNIKRCAIYTRRSIEEPLEIEFNSIQAQRQICESFIDSQKSEGWMCIATKYDDVGYTGANLARPALTQLLQDIKNGNVDIIVVYKIDRLTRSLLNFSYLIQHLENHDATFVSVTQSFNTTTSVGRLTLNILLSFAQFERELISERMRDKIVESRRRGRWIGGTAPLGYSLENKKLTPQNKEAKIIKLIFSQYLQLHSIAAVKEYLDENKIVYQATGRWGFRGEKPISQGGLQKILSNPVYAGKVKQGTTIYPGLHPALIDDLTWESAQVILKKNSRTRYVSQHRIESWLRLRLRTFDGYTYRFSNSVHKNRSYVFYSCPYHRKNKQSPFYEMGNLPVVELEGFLAKNTVKYISNKKYISALLDIQDETIARLIVQAIIRADISKLAKAIIMIVVVHPGKFEITISRKNLIGFFSNDLRDFINAPKVDHFTFELNCHIRKLDRVRLFNVTWGKEDEPFLRTPTDLKNWVRGTIWRDEYFDGKSIAEIAKRENVRTSFVSKCINISLEIPDQDRSGSLKNRGLHYQLI